MNIEKQEELRLEVKQEMYEERMCREDIEYCYKHCGFNDLRDAITEFRNKVNSYGYDISIQDVLDEL